MKNLNKYIVEKLKINKDTKIDKDSMFVIFYSKNNNTDYKLFWEYDDAIKFTKEEYFLDGYYCPIELLDTLCNKILNPPKPIPNNYFDDIRYKWSKENDIIYIFDYKK